MADKRIHIFYGVNDWGLGHASRSAVLINYLLKRDVRITIGCCGDAEQWLKKKFPLLRYVELPAYKPALNFEKLSVGAAFNFARKMHSVRNEENSIIKKMLRTDKVDAIISDNRYGCYSHLVYSIIISHQTTPVIPAQLAVFDKATRLIIKKWIGRFDACWIPDYHSHMLSGQLSGVVHKNTVFIGPVSNLDVDPKAEKKYKLLCILSGTEPQRTQLEEILIRQLSGIEIPALLVQGVGGEMKIKRFKNLQVVSSMQSDEISLVLSVSELVLARAGYSSIMDFYLNAQPAILIPTPGQSEQEYLARYLANKHGFTFFEQGNLDITNVLRMLSDMNQQKKEAKQNLFEATIDELLQRIS